MSKTKAVLELGIELNAIQEYLEDDVLPEYYETKAEFENAFHFVKWALKTHAKNQFLSFGLPIELERQICAMAQEFVDELDVDDDLHDYIKTAELTLNYYRQAWNWDHEHVARFDVRKKAALIAQQILNKVGA
jgi:hypothetical protein